MDGQKSQSILDLPKVVAGAIASPVAALLTSRFGVAGTMIGLALSAVIVTVISDFLKVYLVRVPGAVTSIPGGFKQKSSWGRFLIRLRLPFSKLSSIPPARRRSLLIRSVIAGGIVFVIGLVIVTGLELSAGKDLSCWVWNNCPKESSNGDGKASSTSTLPSILGGGQKANSNAAPQVESVNPQQPAPSEPTPSPGAPEVPVQTPNVPSSQGSPQPLPQSSQQPSPAGLPGNKQPGSSGDSENQQPGTPLPPVS